MNDLERKIKELEEELKRTPYNKATQHHIGLLKARIARLRDQLEKRASRKGGGRGFSVRKEGDATVVLVGPPSVGKSTLLNLLSNAQSEVGNYAFTTLRVIPGMMIQDGIRIQLLDVPGIIEGAHKGRGRGKEVLSVVRMADLVIVMGESPGQIEEVERELYRAGIRLNTQPPNVVIKKKARGGINVSFAVRQSNLDERLVKDMLMEYGIHNAEVVIREDLTLDRLIDALVKGRKYVPSIRVITKCDLRTREQLDDIKKRLSNAIFISAITGDGIDELRREILKKLSLIKVYTKRIGSEPNYDEPLVLKKGSTVRDACDRIHRDFVSRFKFARVWGKSVKFPGQRVGLDYVLEDGDVLELHVDR